MSTARGKVVQGFCIGMLVSSAIYSCKIRSTSRSTLVNASPIPNSGLA
jgi:hypothetical protein